MTPTKDKQAQEYAEKKNRAMRKAWFEYRYGPMREGDDWENDPVKPSDNFEKGFMAGVSFREQSMWRSVKEELPEDREHIIICYQSYHEGRWLTLYITDRYEKESGFNGGWIKPEHVIAWMPIPELPNTNTAKR